MAPFKLSFRAGIASSVAVCRNDMSSHTTRSARKGLHSHWQSLVQQPVRLIADVAKSERSQIPFGHLLQTARAASPFEKESDLKKIPLQSEHSTFVSWMRTTCLRRIEKRVEGWEMRADSTPPCRHYQSMTDHCTNEMSGGWSITASCLISQW